MRDEVLKLALEALESADWYINQLEITLYSADDAGTHEDRLKVQQAITVLRLEIDAQNMSSKPVPENFIDALRFDTAVRDVDAMIAVARADEREACAKVIESWRKWGADVALLVKDIRTMSDPVCTASPAAQRQWVGLTDEEMQALWDRYAHMEMMRAIEAKLKERNQ